MSTIVYVEKVSDTEKVVMEREGGSTKFIDGDPFLKFYGQPVMSLAKKTDYVFKHKKAKSILGIRYWTTVCTEKVQTTNMVIPPYKSIIATMLSRPVSQVA